MQSSASGQGRNKGHNIILGHQGQVRSHISKNSYAQKALPAPKQKKKPRLTLLQPPAANASGAAVVPGPQVPQPRMCVETVYKSGMWYLGWVVAVLSSESPVMRVVYEDGDDECVSWASGEWRVAVPTRKLSAKAKAALAQKHDK